MPRRWTNSNGGNGGGNVKHRFVESAPVRMTDHRGNPADPRVFDQVLATNAKIASNENKFSTKSLAWRIKH
jgi:hypothetical protein